MSERETLNFRGTGTEAPSARDFLLMKYECPSVQVCVSILAIPACFGTCIHHDCERDGILSELPSAFIVPPGLPLYSPYPYC